MRAIVVVTVFAVIPLTVSAQSKKRPITKKPVDKPTSAATAPVPAASPTPEPIKKNSGKANVRPDQAVAPTLKNYVPVYFYMFDRPGFTYSQINIEHDENGRGQVSMRRDGYDEMWTDPLQLSQVTMERLRSAFTALNFLDSTENYQYSRDYAHLGNLTITLKRDGKERTAKFNWTENKDAKALMDEYRRISNEYTWRLEILAARENQPLMTPGLMETIDGYLQRNELTDPPHLLPFLTELSTDERLPLMARNRASRMIERIQKAANKH